ncbi:nucleotidyltransferase domain-containing protein [Patescibacteria group bacterium]|nr:nucleotidyltransferase domain-containing protein [Patescibacteria group bacterium]MBU1500262.1 nucleotidyltransferase domain-containing protein [Patescibacteria group bacterium]
MNGKIKKTVKKIISQLKDYQPEKIILYGSLARGELANDIDLLVIKKTKKNYFSRLQEINQRYLDRWRLDVPLDLTVYTPDEFARAKREKRVFIDQVEKYGQILYQKTV